MSSPNEKSPLINNQNVVTPPTQPNDSTSPQFIPVKPQKDMAAFHHKSSPSPQNLDQSSPSPFSPQFIPVLETAVTNKAPSTAATSSSFKKPPPPPLPLASSRNSSPLSDLTEAVTEPKSDPLLNPGHGASTAATTTDESNSDGSKNKEDKSMEMSDAEETPSAANKTPWLNVVLSTGYLVLSTVSKVLTLQHAGAGGAVFATGQGGVICGWGAAVGNFFALAEINKTTKENQEMLKAHGKMLKAHGKMLKELLDKKKQDL